MSAQEKVAELNKPKSYSVPLNHGYVTGRLGSRTTVQLKEGKRWLQLLVTPAPDPYSMPSVIELKSKDALGQEGDDWSGHIKIGGYPNNYEVTDRDGVIKQVRSARVVLEVVES